MAAPTRTRRRKPAPKRRRNTRRRAPARPTAWERSREAAGRQLRGHGADALAVGLVVIGLLHLAGGSPPVDPTAGLRNAGGLLGAAVASPLAAGAGVVGTAVILTGLGLLGLLLAPGVPMRRVFDAIAAGARWAAVAVSGLFQLREHDAGEAALDEPEPAAAVEVADELDEDDVELDDVPEPEVYDPVAETYPEPPARTTVEPGGQVAIDLGPGYRPGTWKLPPSNVLKRGTKHEIDRRFVEEGGQVLAATLAEFGVVGKLSGMAVR